jgi:hypothetical protein
MKKYYLSEREIKRFKRDIEYFEDDFSLEDYCLDELEDDDVVGDICDCCDDDCSQCSINLFMYLFD